MNNSSNNQFNLKKIGVCLINWWYFTLNFSRGIVQKFHSALQSNFCSWNRMEEESHSIIVPCPAKQGPWFYRRKVGINFNKESDWTQISIMPFVSRCRVWWNRVQTGFLTFSSSYNWILCNRSLKLRNLLYYK